MSRRSGRWMVLGALLALSLVDMGCARVRRPDPPAIPQAPAAPPALPPVAGVPPAPGTTPGANPGTTPGQTPPAQVPPAQAPAAPVDANLRPDQPIVSGAAGTELDAAVVAYGQTLTAGPYCGSVMVAKEGRILLDKGYGTLDGSRPMPHNALWDWASVGKHMTAAAVLKARMEGRISLDDTVAKYYPNCPADKREIKIRHLLSHSSGVDNNVVPNFLQLDRDGTVNDFLARRQVAPPGTLYAYSPMSSFNIAAACLEKSTGGSFDAFMKEKIWGPAGMRDVGFMGQGTDMSRVPKSERGTAEQFIAGGMFTWAYRGSGGVVTTARELFTWDQALRGTAVLNADAKTDFYTVQIDNYALGWKIGNGADVTYDHAGNNGVGTFRYKRLRDANIVVAFAASHREAGEAGALVDRLIEIAKKPQAVP